MNRRRVREETIPEELRTQERLSTKKEAAQRRPLSCPSIKLRKSMNRQSKVKSIPKPIFFDEEKKVNLSGLFNPNSNVTYLEQIFVRYGKLGEGSFGEVYKVCSREDHKPYAIKHIRPNMNISDGLAEVRNNEIIGAHEFCVRYYMAWQERGELFLLLEQCDMSMADYSAMNNVPDEALSNILHDICSALYYLHNKGFLHLDVKPANIMMHLGMFKLGDFGLLVDLNGNGKPVVSTLSDGDSKYLAVETLEGSYTPACDIFSLGITLLELASDLELPEHGPLWQQLRRSILPTEFYNCDASLGMKVVIEKMLSEQPSSRPTAGQILRYHFVRDVHSKYLKGIRTDFAAAYRPANETHLELTGLLTNSVLLNTGGDSIDNLHHHNSEMVSGRKALKFSFNEDHPFDDVENNSFEESSFSLQNFDTSSDSMKSTLQNSALEDSGVVGDDCGNFSYRAFNTGSDLISPPNLKDRNRDGTRRLPRSKLHFKKPF